ncbi:MAG TPA: N-(5'-phosphoribosyl)anthranilate isomerase, partial [Phycisphaerales bacterium]|nr:N-(5'-phosphoribosyl)anthranilate isomerase [Phycisphaerales bacterium]
RFDVTELAKLIPLLTKPVIIAGGLTVGNVAKVIHTAKPRAVDVSSGVESSSGTKDPTKICEFVNIVKGL